jgi:hypothetical protein
MKSMFSVTALSALIAVFACAFSGCSSSNSPTGKMAKNQMENDGGKMEPGMSPMLNDRMAPKMDGKTEPKMNPSADSK